MSGSNDNFVMMERHERCSDEIYTLMSGSSCYMTIKDRRKGKMRKGVARMTTYSMVEFPFQDDILRLDPDKDTVSLAYTNGYRLYDDLRLSPIDEESMVEGEVNWIKRGKAVNISVDSEDIVHNYRTIKILESLPVIGTEDVSDIKAAEGLARLYGDHTEKEGLLETCRDFLEDTFGLDLDSLRSSNIVSNKIDEYARMIDSVELDRLANELPRDDHNYKIDPDGRTGLVVIR